MASRAGGQSGSRARWRWGSGALGILIGGSLAGCATNPATGQREVSLVSESQEIALGEQTATAARAAIGVYPDSGLQRYVRGVGMRLSGITERASLPWNFEVVDDPEVNAFAAPGGKIFVTRGILNFLGSEAELAGVLGHEAGHVTARHTARQITRQQLFGIGLIAGAIFSTSVAQNIGAIQQGLGLLFLSYSRGDETQADELGFRYVRRLNYDPREMAETFGTLDRISTLAGGGRVPTWASTHPDPGDRATKATQRAAAVPPDSLQRSVVSRDAYLRQIEGIVFGVNPRQGYFEASRFFHPDLRFRMDFPSGWKTQNQAQAVSAISGGNDAIVQLSLGGSQSPDALIQEFVRQEGVRTGSVQRTTVNGLTAATAEFQAQDNQGNQLAGRVLYLSYGSTTYQLLGYTLAARYGGYSGAFLNSMQSFSQLTDPVVLNKQPVHLRLVRLSRAMTIEEFHRQYPSPVRVEIIAAINGVSAGQTLPVGFTAKRVQ
ncbi:MAG TPA: M48 family metalloprotease [Gemmatimonadales bacterium]|nr:M48 family metalloprotease [Gemmatimonadales bacterium]